MGATSYISSGLIEAYVSGLASSNEREELELAMAQYPEVAAEYQNCQLDMEQYVSLQSVPPPTSIRERLLGRIGDEETARANGTYVDENDLPEEPVEKVLVSSAWRWVAAAAILLLLIGGMLYFDLYTRYNDYKSKFEAMAVSKNAMASEMNAYHTRMVEMDKTLQMVKDPSMKMVRMPGTKSFPTAMATVFWNQASKEVFVMVNNLPAPAADKQYQLWAIVAGKPVDMGVFDTGNSTQLMQQMKSIDNAEMFAVTLEKKGGSPAPTLDQLYVAGKI